ncbi:MAG: DUF386 family protein [Candidatus Lokiarchaeota archaeon]|nr:DUF386 family protein [Candidatus Lokiarchaeota archaeon]
MIADSLSNMETYPIFSADKFKVAFDWIKQHTDDTPGTGVHNLDFDVRIIVETYKPVPIGSKDFETHRRYIDIQYLVEGIEWLFWTKPLNLAVTKPYNEKKDIEFFGCADPFDKASCIRLENDVFVALWPGDWHMPSIAPTLDGEQIETVEAVLKFVAKIPV